MKTSNSFIWFDLVWFGLDGFMAYQILLAISYKFLFLHVYKLYDL